MPASKVKARLRAAELIEHTREHSGRIHRFAGRVFVLTNNAELAEWLMKHGAEVSPGVGKSSSGYYLRASDGEREWDLSLSTVPLLDDEPAEALWEAAAP